MDKPQVHPAVRIAQRESSLSHPAAAVCASCSVQSGSAVSAGALLSAGRVQVGISSVWYEGNPCNMHLMLLAEEVKKGVQEAGLVGFRFNTVGVSDAISMGTSADELQPAVKVGCALAVPVRECFQRSLRRLARCISQPRSV